MSMYIIDIMSKSIKILSTYTCKISYRIAGNFRWCIFLYELPILNISYFNYSYSSE